jgi:hypothetical protein
MHKRAGLAEHLRRAARGADEILVPRWVPYLFAVFSLALAPGIARVFAAAPPLHLAMHWRLAWGGFDVALAVLLAATGLALFRRSALAEVLAAMTATLLCCDAWLDVLSSAGQGTAATVISIGEAALVELPLAALFTWVAVRFAGAVAEARPALQRAGFRIRHRRLLPPAGGYPALRDAEAAGSQPRWRQWTPRGHAGQPGLLLPWWLPAACLGLVLVLIPWTAWLFVTLPQTELGGQWGLARAGLDLALAIVLAASAVALLRRWPGCGGTGRDSRRPAAEGRLVQRSYGQAGAFLGSAGGGRRTGVAAGRPVPVGCRPLRTSGRGRLAVRALTTHASRPPGRRNPAGSEMAGITWPGAPPPRGVRSCPATGWRSAVRSCLSTPITVDDFTGDPRPAP